MLSATNKKITNNVETIVKDFFSYAEDSILKIIFSFLP